MPFQFPPPKHAISPPSRNFQPRNAFMPGKAAACQFMHNLHILALSHPAADAQ